MDLTVIKNGNLALTFFLELSALIGLAYWGFQTGPTSIAKFVLGIGAPLVAVVVWALFGAPRADWHLEGVARVILQILYFGSAALAFYSTGNRFLGLIFALICVLNGVLNYVWTQ
jgi:hypothetical protein